MKHPGHTPFFLTPDGEVIPDSIADVAYMRLGGVDQWVMIRGESVRNPLMVVLHGGPGLSETPFLRHFKDRRVPPETSIDYFNALTAPSKKVIWFDESAHEMFVDEPEKFNDAMVRIVRPVCPE